ncbi:MAG: hypothetical protein AAB865_01505 [Patescibacteria group bacterium]
MSTVPSKTPNFDAKIKPILDALPEGKEAEICRKFQVPPITMSPEKQLNHLSGFNTGLAFFWKPHKDTDKPILSAIHPDNPIPVVTEDEWASADYSSFGKSIDPSRSVMDQLWDLVCVVPHNPTRCVQTIDSVAVGCVSSQSSYCVSMSHVVNRCFYTYALLQGEDCLDAGNGMQVARSYQCGGSNEISDCQYIYESRACLNSSFLFDCWNCDSCFGATNQRNKKHLFFNEQLTKEEYDRRVAEIDLSDATVADTYWKRFLSLWKTDGVWPATFGYGNEEAEGEHLFGCVRSEGCFWQNKSTDCYRLRLGAGNNGCAYASGEGYEQDCYMTTGGTYGSKNKFCASGSKCMSCEYCHNCRECENCFACVGLQYKKFHIFNKEYSEEEYWKRVDELKCRMMDDGEYGKFFPAKFSASGFEYSAGAIYAGYSPEQLAAIGAPTFDPRRGQVFGPQPTEAQTIEASAIPTRLDDPNVLEVIGKAIHDPELDRNFTILPAEFEIYKAKRWPLPRRHFVSRLTDLVRLSNSPIEEQATCGSCSQSITTYRNFSFPTRIVYCNACYLKFLETR